MCGGLAENLEPLPVRPRTQGRVRGLVTFTSRARQRQRRATSIVPFMLTAAGPGLLYDDPGDGFEIGYFNRLVGGLHGLEI